MAGLQTIFSRVIYSNIPSAVPSQLCLIDQFGVGKVLIFSKKPQRFLPQKNEDLKFTGWSLSSLLDESSLSELQITAATSREFETSKDDPIKVVVDLSEDSTVTRALEDLELDAGGSKQATISADFGKVTNNQASLLHTVSQKKLHVKMDHPIIQEAISTGGTLFVTTTVYEAERCHLHVSLGDVQKEVFSRDEPTALAFLLLKLSIDRHGLLLPKRNNGFLNVLDKHDHHSLLPTSCEQTPHPSAEEESPDLFKKRIRHRESLEVEGWIVVDILNPGQIPEEDHHQNEPVPVPENPILSSDSESEKLPTQPPDSESEKLPTQPPDSESEKLPTQPPDSESEKLPTQPPDSESEKLPTQPPDSESEKLPTQPPDSESEKLSIQLPDSTEKSPIQPSAADEEGSKVTGNSAQPVPVVEEVMAQEVTDLTSPPPVPIPGDDEQPSNPQLDEHFIYSLKDFQPFESQTYRGIYNEVEEWVKPLVTSKKLHSAYLSYVTPPRTSEKLKKLSQFLQEHGKAHRARKPTPAVTYAPMKPVISALNPEWSTQMDEVSSMIVVTEALIEFPQHIIKKAIELSSEKRTTLVDFVCSTPYGVDKHVYIDEGPFHDPELKPFMTRMGFSLPPHTKALVLNLGHEENEDRLAAGLILMLSTQLR